MNDIFKNLSKRSPKLSEGNSIFFSNFPIISLPRKSWKNCNSFLKNLGENICNDVVDVQTSRIHDFRISRSIFWLISAMSHGCYYISSNGDPPSGISMGSKFDSEQTIPNEMKPKLKPAIWPWRECSIKNILPHLTIHTRRHQRHKEDNLEDTRKLLTSSPHPLQLLHHLFPPSSDLGTFSRKLRTDLRTLEDHH